MPTRPTPQPDERAADIAAYEALRRGGAPPTAARTQLSLSPAGALRLETIFSGRASRGAGDEALPKFARHDAHVEAVMAEGGYPALSERRRGKEGACVCLPLTRPGADFFKSHGARDDR